MSEELQGTVDWHADRAGKFTGSKFADLLARSKKDGKPLKAYHDLIWQVVTERMTGQAIEGPEGFALAWGRMSLRLETLSSSPGLFSILIMRSQDALLMVLLATTAVWK